MTRLLGSDYMPTLSLISGNTVPINFPPEAPIAVGGALFMPLGSSTLNKALMFKSTDGGLTWIELDAGNRPFSFEQYSQR